MADQPPFVQIKSFGYNQARIVDAMLAPLADPQVRSDLARKMAGGDLTLNKNLQKAALSIMEKVSDAVEEAERGYVE
jgi:hypothetical protein